MAILPLIQVPDNRLRRLSQPVSRADLLNISSFIDSMTDTMYHNNGIGLSAIQVGVEKRIIVIDLDSIEGLHKSISYPKYFINPIITNFSKEICIVEEGCLSIPNHCVSITRSSEIYLRYVDANGKTKEMKASGWLSRVIQHEYDHLNGKLLIDYL